MMESMVDYILERGNQDYGQFSKKGEPDSKSTLFNHRKLLEHLFHNNETTTSEIGKLKRISDLKLDEISGQLNYFSEKLHAELNKKNLKLDDHLYELENLWIKKKIPDFYCYYFLKFAYANTYSRMHELILSEIQNMNREKDSFLVVKKTIEAREICLINVRRQISSLTELDIQESMQTLREERKLRKKKEMENDQKGYKKKKNKQQSEEEVGKSWRNKLEVVFQSISHLRKLTSFVVELIKNWKNAIYGISDDPRRYRERVIFYHNDANYLIKMVFDNKFVYDTELKKYLSFANHYDPFLLKPCMVLQNKQRRTQDQDIFLNLIKPKEGQMGKMVRALVILAEEEYDEDQQSKFLFQRKNYGQLEQRKKFIEKRRDNIGTKSAANLKQKQDLRKSGKLEVKFKNDKKSNQTEKELEQIKKEKNDQNQIAKIQTALSRVKKIRSVDLKKVSPYLSRTEKISKAQKVLELEHKFRTAQNDYIESVKRKKAATSRKQEMMKEWDAPPQQVTNNKIFNRYIEENLKLMDEANKKAYVYKNKVPAKKHQSVQQSLNYNRVSFRDRKEAEYQRNLQQYQRDQRTASHTAKRQKKFTEPAKKHGTRPVIEISSKGIKSNQGIIDYEIHGKKGKNVGKILQNAQKEQQKRMIEEKMSPIHKHKGHQTVSKQGQREQEKKVNLYESEKAPEIIIMRQEPEKIEQIKQFLYVKIKQQLMEEMKKNKEQKQQQIQNLIEEQKRKKLEQMIQQQRLEQIRQKQEEERRRLAQLQKQRKKIDFEIKVEPIQYSEENASQYFQKIFSISPQTYHRLFSNQKIEQKKEQLIDEFYLIFLRGFLDGEEVANCVVRYDWKFEAGRKLIFEYVTVNNFYHFISSFHRFCEYLWKNDPVQYLEMTMLHNYENEEGSKVIEDVQEYADRSGQTFEKTLYSNIKELKYVWSRPKLYNDLKFPYSHFYFGRKFNLKSELLSSAVSLNERYKPKIDMNLEVFTNYVFLLEEIFRKYLTPEEVVELRENSTNIRRLKDIFRIVIQLQKKNPSVDQLTIVEGLNLDDLYEKVKEKMKPPYDKYFWHHFYDKSLSNRLLLAILQFKLELQFPINSCHLNDRKFLRINPRRKILILKSSVYARQNIYVLNTTNPKIRMFLMQGEQYKLMRIQLFVFLNLVFNNIVEDSEQFVNSFWVPQFKVNDDAGKDVRRITDFSISMKKSFFLSEQIYFCNHEYIKNAFSFLPKKSDVIFREAMIVGFLHTSVESASTGMPLYAKMIDTDEMFE